MRSIPRAAVFVIAALYACEDNTRQPTPGPAPTQHSEPDASVPLDAAVIGSPPVAVARVDRATGAAPHAVRFDASESTDADGDISGYVWDFGDGSGSTEPSVAHVFTAPGVFTATLTVFDGTGNSAKANVTVTAEDTCPEFDDGVQTGLTDHAVLREISGIAASRKNPGVLWANNDSGDANRVYALGRQGKIIGAYNLRGSQAADWEDMAIGPGPVPAEHYLYVADIGDNNQTSNIAPVYRAREPVVALDQVPSIFDLNDVQTIALRYPNNAAYNAETIFVDPENGDIWIVTKHPQGASLVFHAPAPHATLLRLTTTSGMQRLRKPLSLQTTRNAPMQNSARKWKITAFINRAMPITPFLKHAMM